MATDIKTQLAYNRRTIERGYFFARERTEQEKKKFDQIYKGEVVQVDKLVKDGRGKDLTLDECSFELVHHNTSLSTEDFYNDREKITNTYFEEMKELLKKVTGAEYVFVLHHQVRCADKQNKNGVTDLTSSVQGYAHGIHSDTSCYSAEQGFKKYVANTPDPERCSKGRFMYVNVWRNISETPIENNHLAVCDERSLVKPDDYNWFELYGPGYEILQYQLDDRNSDAHDWYYFPKMTKNEAIIFKQWDSDKEKTGRTCFHTAFADLNASPNAATRESIEVRAYCFFPDHTPNTCPPITTGVEHTGDLTIDGAVNKMLSMATSLHAWPNEGLWWLKIELAKGKSGVKSIATRLVADENGLLGLKSLPQETKDKIVEVLLNDTDFEKVLKKSFDLAKSRVQVSKISFNVSLPKATFATILSIGIGWGLCMLYSKRRL